MSHSELRTAGQRVAVALDARDPMRAAVTAAAGEPLTETTGPCDLLLDRLGVLPSLDTLEPVTRGVWAGRAGVLVDSVGGSGFTQLWHRSEESSGESAHFRVSSRWAPSAAANAAARLLPQRHRALRSQVLLHYPALWAALAARNLSPLHVSVVEVQGRAVLLAGPGGVGKSSLVADALAHGSRAVCDNLGVSDGRVVHGLLEPLRLPAGVAAAATPDASGTGRGPRAAHGRREHAWSGRLASLAPELVVVVRREDHGTTRLRPISSDDAARSVVAGTYAAGELQRFWPLVAQLALAGLGPVHAPVERTAAVLDFRAPLLRADPRPRARVTHDARRPPRRAAVRRARPHTPAGHGPDRHPGSTGARHERTHRGVHGCHPDDRRSRRGRAPRGDAPWTRAATGSPSSPARADP